MTESRFRSLSVGDRVCTFAHNRVVSNQYLKLNEFGKPVSYIEVPSAPGSAYEGTPLILSEQMSDVVDYLGGPR